MYSRAVPTCPLFLIIFKQFINSVLGKLLLKSKINVIKLLYFSNRKVTCYFLIIKIHMFF
ncbi:hypothetical protein FWK35_00036132 [Aphis craccivora]|uniref:Uncharacterized protein n=1 Tax=Aphis craccivora TaxID=307492 RepID=A0A6G0Y3M6_APHCR|nr:hypothetical protein FWK35_00036132 [Aphis craccivora]